MNIDIMNIFLFLKKGFNTTTAVLLFSFVSEIPACMKFDVMMDIALLLIFHSFTIQ